jgi:hypothetical protein
MGVQAHFRRTKLVLEIIALGRQIGVLWRCHNDSSSRGCDRAVFGEVLNVIENAEMDVVDNHVRPDLPISARPNPIGVPRRPLKQGLPCWQRRQAKFALAR